jgi:hypothetical protein
MIDWEYLLTQFKVHGTVEPVTDMALDKVEDEMGFRLPSAFREFYKVFGAGEMIDRDFRFMLPEEWKAEHEALTSLFNPEIKFDVNRIRFFARHSPPVDGFFWNLDEVTAPKHNEYRIYVFDHGYTEHFGENFTEFMFQRILSGKGVLARDGLLKMDFFPRSEEQS